MKQSMKALKGFFLTTACVFCLTVAGTSAVTYGQETVPTVTSEAFPTITPEAVPTVTPVPQPTAVPKKKGLVNFQPFPYIYSLTGSTAPLYSLLIKS